ncbi:MAG: hypothetical protein NT096_10585 [Proteobacteria bacterium]|nr:hypothetical protein [Pseudomonadota bacterium]
MQKAALLFDIDNTLTPPRQPLTKFMSDVLSNINIPFHVAAGSHFPLLDAQFFQPLYEYGFHKQFEAFISNGAIHYTCDYSKGKNLTLVTSFNIRNYLGETDYTRVIEILNRLESSKEFPIPPSVKVVGNKITFRESMINFSPIGRVEKEDFNSIRNRYEFADFDRKTGFRSKLLLFLRNELTDLIRAKRLTITLGGQTSFDIGIEDQDKTIAVRTILDQCIDKIIFVGDDLREDGNDAAIRHYVERTKAPVELREVTSYIDTVKYLLDHSLIKREKLVELFRENHSEYDIWKTKYQPLQ